MPKCDDCSVIVAHVPVNRRFCKIETGFCQLVQHPGEFRFDVYIISKTRIVVIEG